MEPFDTLRTELSGWTLAFSELEPGVMGFCDHDRQTIWVDVNLNARERRTTMMHEIVHAIRGHRSDDPDDEHATRIETAAHLIPTVALLAAFVHPFHPRDIRDSLDVDLDVLRTRLEHLSDDERCVLRRRLIGAPGTAACQDCTKDALERWLITHADTLNPQRETRRFTGMRLLATTRTGQAAAGVVAGVAAIRDSHARTMLIDTVTNLMH